MKQGIFITLDSLLDTRIATIAAVDSSLATQLLSKGWVNRTSLFGDDLLDIPLEEVKAKWKTRDIEILKTSLLTGWIGGLNTLIFIISQEMGINPRIEELSITINMYPYQLTPTVAASICEAVELNLEEPVPIKYVYIPDTYVDHHMVKGNFAAVVHHDWDEFSLAQLHNFPKYSMPETKYFFPKLSLIKTDEDLGMVFDSVAAPLVPLMGIEWEAAKHYSIAI